MKNLLYGFLGCGGLAAIVYFLLPQISKLFGGGDINVRKAVHELTQKIGQGKIKEIEKTESIVKIKIDKKEELSKESIKKIKTIQKKAAKEIEEILKETKITEIHKEIDNDWDDL